MSIDFKQCRELLQGFEFRKLFIEQFNWSRSAQQKPQSLQVEGFKSLAIAEMRGVVVYEISGVEIPGAAVREEIHREISKRAAENLLIFLNGDRDQSLWYWVKREDGRSYPREHIYEKNGVCDLLLSKIISLRIPPEELPNISTFEVADRLAQGLDVERVTKKFFQEFQEQHGKFLELIRAQGVSRDSEARWYASVLLNRLMFVYFLQRKGFLDGGNINYLQDKLRVFQQQESDRFYDEFLKVLFFQGFAAPEYDRLPKVNNLLGNIKYLNGGLFLEHEVEKSYPEMRLPDAAFAELFKLFESYSWNLDDTPGGNEKEINPAVLGYIFEKYINQKEFGAYYTRPEITEYLCDRTINKLILDRVNQNSARKFTNITELLTNLTPPLCHKLLGDLSEDNPRNGILPSLSLLDPACGSGAFLVAAMKSLIYVYERVFGRIQFLGDDSLTRKVKDIERRHSSVNYYIKKRIISDNLYGVDIMEEATEIAKLRLFLALVSAAESVDQLEPLPNIDFNIMAGNSLIGLMRVNGESFDQVGNSAQTSLLQLGAAQDYQSILRERNLSVEDYKRHAFLLGEVHETPQEDRLGRLRRSINEINKISEAKLNELLFNEFVLRLSIKYEQAQLVGKPKKRDLTIEDIARLKPFHWGFHFNQIIENGGFDAIIANPPWEIFKPQAKEFFGSLSPDLVAKVVESATNITKNKMDIKVFEKEQKRLLETPEVAAAWLDYLSRFPYVSSYYRSAEQYKNQISIVNGKKSGTDINLYKLFLEQCFNLLREGGECGIVIPSGVYTDLGTKQLREMLFTETQITGLFCFENRRTIFEGVDSRFKFVVLTFEKNLPKENEQSFPVSFMRHDVQELTNFPNESNLKVSTELIRKLSPDSLSIMEFKSSLDVVIAKKMLRFPLLGEEISDKWNLRLTAEFHMTNDSYLFKQEPAPGRLPLYEGKMIHQFTHQWGEPRYWVDEQEARKALLGKNQVDSGQKLDYQGYRLGFRDIARNTDVRTMISTVVPPNIFTGNTLIISQQFTNLSELIFITSILDSFTCDSMIRQKVTAHCNMFYVYQLPIPRLSSGDKYFDEIVTRAAKLICTTPEFDELAQEVGLMPRNPPHPLTPSPTRGEGGQEHLSPLSRSGRGAGGEGLQNNQVGGEDIETQAWEITPELHKKMVEIARQFRKQPTPSEKILWQELRGRQLDNHKFRRQQPIGIFVVDFFCAAERLIVEVDGGIHESQQELDRQRQELLESLGLRFIRVSSDRVENNLSSVLEEIHQAILNPMNPPHPLTPSPTRGEGEHENLAPLSPLGKGARGEGFYGATDPEERAELRAELDGIVAHLYGLTEIEFTHILSTFPLVPEETKTAALQAYQNLGKPLVTSEIATLIKQGENNLVEFKSTARWNLRENKADKIMEQVILKSVAAFLNTNGGTLLIGVEDNGNILGLAADYQTLKKKDSDGFLLFISNDLLLKEFGKEYANLFDIKIHEINGLEICQINIKPAPQEMYVNITNKNGATEECFYIRSANSALKLSTKEAVKYIKTHWK